MINMSCTVPTTPTTTCSSSQSETGEQLLARLAAKPDLTNLETNVLPEGPNVGTVTELCGEEGCGKTQFLLHLLVKAILPIKWNGWEIGGLETGVLLIDTECQISVVRLMGILGSRVQQTGSNSGDPGLSEENTEQVIRDALKRLHLVRCHSSETLLFTLQSVESLLSSQSNIGVLLIDGMSSFYWIDRSNAGDSNSLREAAYSKITNAVSHLTRTYKLATFATTIPLFQKRAKKSGFEEEGYGGATARSSESRESHEYSDYLGRSWKQLVSQRLVLAKDPWHSSQNAPPTFSVALCPSHGASGAVRKFTLGDDGVHFL